MFFQKRDMQPRATAALVMVVMFFLRKNLFYKKNIFLTWRCDFCVCYWMGFACTRFFMTIMTSAYTAAFQHVEKRDVRHEKT
jgi:hypothetical protein